MWLCYPILFDGSRAEKLYKDPLIGSHPKIWKEVKDREGKAKHISSKKLRRNEQDTREGDK